MATTEQLLYPQAFIAMDGGDLVQVTNFAASLTNNSSQKHTLRRKGAGFTDGVTESTVTFTAILDEDGSERPYWRLVQKKLVKQIRCKLPGGEVLTFNGRFRSVNTNGPLDDAASIDCEFIGHMEDSE